jgi:hypothetical protein
MSRSTLWDVVATTIDDTTDAIGVRRRLLATGGRSELAVIAYPTVIDALPHRLVPTALRALLRSTLRVMQR